MRVVSFVVTVFVAIILLFTFPSANILIVHNIFQMQRAFHPFFSRQFAESEFILNPHFSAIYVVQQPQKISQNANGKMKRLKKWWQNIQWSWISEKTHRGREKYHKRSDMSPYSSLYHFFSTKDKEKNSPLHLKRFHLLDRLE